MEPLRHDLRSVAAQLMAQDSAHDLAHLDRVWENCRQIAYEEGGDLRLLCAAAYLHDLVNLPKDAPNRAAASGLAAEAAAAPLEALGYAEAEIAAVQHAIRAHSFSAGIEPESLEARILRDADRLDALGALGLARCFAVSGQLGRPLYHPEDPFARARPLDDRAFALDHFPLKLLRLAEGMTTPTGHRLAQARRAEMLHFLARLAEEIGQSTPDHWRPADD